MKKLFHNSKQEPRIFYARHIAPGVCGYEDETVFLNEDTLRKMDATFAGKPIYVGHQKVNLDNLQEEAQGYVVESFFLPEDGAHWAKIIIVGDDGHEAVGKGWAVSNAYMPEAFGAGGEWHNIAYNREITDAYYTHLALVDNPRYEEATIMTPEDFKTYKESKREQLKQLENSKTKQGEKRKMNWKLFEKKEVTNSEDIENKMVELSNGSTVSIREMINAVEEEIKEKKDKCNEEDILEKVVKVNGEDMKVSELVEAFEKKSKKNEDKDEEKKDADDKDEEKDKEAKKASKKNEDEEKKEKESEDDKDEEKKDEEEEKSKEDKKNAKDLLEAEEKANAKRFQGQVVDTMSRKLARGQERYGSAK